ncbi:FHA domain protein [Stieleria maiorica]|uniref:FHA domain protein n=1 Tax=Stieleria maiorica TaxID=2795974 RepID=A0A5B9MD58_9BACT|nr:FHA domain-containing protein [Stieleria maiorica]QEF97425.1 FHA domain protein [Stieleria maiorica]
MFNITLLQTNGSRKGTRYHLETSPFLIGRGDECDVTFSSRSVSRKHCSIVFDDANVWVQDLNSRNGTVVGGDPLAPDVPRQLSHHDRLRIGKYTFRISIRDRQTRKPHRFGPVDLSTLSGPGIVPQDRAKGAAQLLSELDELAARLDRPSDGKPRPADRAIQARPGTEPERDVTSATSASSPADKLRDDASTQSGDADESDESTKVTMADEPRAKASDDEPSTDTKKIPPHLRPKGPKDSQSAASAALRNLFVR